MLTTELHYLERRDADKNCIAKGNNETFLVLGRRYLPFMVYPIVLAMSLIKKNKRGNYERLFLRVI